MDYKISSDFTIEDIRIIREAEYARLKSEGMTVQEMVSDTTRRGKEAMIKMGLVEHHIPSPEVINN
jgi:hypothetical protein